jgi:hypothetical protein
MKKQYLVIDLNDNSFTYIVDNINSLIEEIYECELEEYTEEQVNKMFYDNYLVYEIEGTIVNKIG